MTQVERYKILKALKWTCFHGIKYDTPEMLQYKLSMWHGWVKDKTTTLEQKLDYVRRIQGISPNASGATFQDYQRQCIDLLAVFYPEVNSPLWKAMKEEENA